MKECYKPKTSDEIQKASEEYILKTHIDDASVQDHFIAGAEWMRDKMIEKAADWLGIMVIEYLQGDVTYIFTHEMIGDFRKAMQDESKFSEGVCLAHSTDKEERCEGECEDCKKKEEKS